MVERGTEEIKGKEGGEKMSRRGRRENRAEGGKRGEEERRRRRQKERRKERDNGLKQYMKVFLRNFT